MPQESSVFAIPYPCETDPITTRSFFDYATVTETALSNVSANADKALLPPAVAVTNNSGQTVSTGVTTTMTYTTFNYDRGGFWNPGTPTLLTIPSDGSYFLATTSSANLTGNVTSLRWTFLVNGVEVAYWENQNTGPIIPVSKLGLNVLAVGLVAGDQIQLNALYTGTQPTLSFFGRVNVTRLAIP